MSGEGRKQLVPFQFHGQTVRIHIDDAGNPWWVAKDVCKILGLEKNVGQAISGLDEDEKCFIDPNIFIGDVGTDRLFEASGFPARTAIPEAGRGGRPLAFISESGLYALVFRSRKPEARTFSKWVRAEVLPSLRKTGRYAMPGYRPKELPPEMEEIPLPEEALRLRPILRQKLWQDALQTARLDNAGSGAAQEWFVRLCRMMTAERPKRAAWKDVEEFMDQCLEEAQGCNTSFARIYDAFTVWWETQVGRREMPGMKSLSNAVAERFRRYKSNSMMFKNCRLLSR